MNWGQIAALSLDPRSRGMGFHNMPVPGLAGSKPWKHIGMTKSEWKAEKKSQKQALKLEYGGLKTKAQMKAHIEALKASKSGLDKAGRIGVKLQIEAAEAAKRSLQASGDWHRPSPTANAPVIDIGDGPTDPGPGDVTPNTPDPTPGDVWNTDQNGTPEPADDTVYTTMPVTTPAPTSSTGGGSTVNISTPSGGGSTLPTGRTMWDAVDQVTKGNTTMLLAGAAVLAYLVFFRKK